MDRNQRYGAIQACGVGRPIAKRELLLPRHAGDVGIFENAMISLNSTSLFLWKQFEEPNTIDGVIQKAEAVYDDPSGRMGAEIRQFVFEYEKAGLLKEVVTDE